MPPTLNALAILGAIERNASFARVAEARVCALTKPRVFAGALDVE
jgi:hypothetical protein